MSPLCLGDDLHNIYLDHVKPTLVDGFDHGGIAILGAGAIGAFIALEYDNKVQRFFSKKDRFPRGFTKLGNSLGAKFVMFGVAGIQLIFDRNNGLAHFETLLATATVVTLSKQFIKKKRPDGENLRSFPSGHTSTAFASAGSLSYAYGWKAAVPSYLLATTTFFARLDDNKHWLSDLVVATTIGVFFARSSAFHHGNLVPLIFNDGGGLSWNYPY